MADAKHFCCASTRRLYDALQRWAAAELRSLNAQIEFLLRRALSEAGRLPADEGGDEPAARKERS